ncbi:MAG: ABC transporter ATP-binding protein [Thermoplasmatales archaeon]|jgi:iron complex transport system ATP-binding protein|nr:ABC transporter ATP-binding protein [Candidatus Thermoplasmatota archaeon]MCL6002118.1 ABC transporter ATP-binding protein [Candidatus Thermoplasmatota archaeon]MDA8055285.1 ABC transporter ATP-binding protein [Thermoplasmatales archaeon]
MKVELEDVTFRVSSFSLGPLDFSVEEGTITAIIGKNGSGKSTTLKLIHGDLKPNTGSVSIDSSKVSSLSSAELAEKTSFVWQEIYNPMSFSVRDVMNVSGYKRGNDEDSMGEALESVGLSSLIDMDFSVLSGGERRLVTVAAAIYQDSEIMIMDEPTNFLDIDNQIVVYKLLKRLRDAGKTLILTMHDLDAVHNLADSVLILRGGRKVAWGSTSSTLNIENLNKAFNVSFHSYDTVNGSAFAGSYKG